MDEKLMDKFPLSKKKKFWKKMVEKMIIFFFLGFAVGLVGLTASVTFMPDLGTGALTLISIGTGIAFFVICSILYGIYVSYYIKTYFYEDDDNFLTIRKGVFMPTEIHVQYLKIQDVFVDQDILDRIFGIYDVHISSATYSSGIEAHIDGVDKGVADGLKTLLLGKIKNSSTHHKDEAHHAVPAAAGTPEQSHQARGGSVSFSQPISSEAYGLSSDWWISEAVKIAIGSVTTPVLAVIVIYFNITSEGSMTDGSWRLAFWIWLAAFLVYVLYRVIYLFLWQHHYTYTFGNEYIYMKIGVLSVSEKNMGYNTIQDVKIHQTLIDRIFGVADLVIENASPAVMMVANKKTPIGANGIVIEGLSLADAKKIAEEIKQAILIKGGLTKGL